MNMTQEKQAPPRKRPAPAKKPGPVSVIIKGASIPFWDMTVLLVKLALAAIPAMIILLLFSALTLPILMAIFV